MATITLTEDQRQLLEAGLRFCELNHPNFKGEFRKLLNEIYSQLNQQPLFNSGPNEDPRAKLKA